MKRWIAILLCALLLAPSFAVNAASGKGTLRMIAYNVSGIPLVGDFQGTVFTTTNDRAGKIGKLLNGSDADFIGTEEDFNAHKHLAAQMDRFPYRSATSGGLAQGQGLNVFSRHPLYNIQRVNWKHEFGSLSGSMDALSNKGFIYSLMELEKGVYVHVIGVHMDAGYDPLSIRSRARNFRQLAAFIQENLNDGRALIVQGDFNYKFKRQLKDDIVGNLLEPTGLKDVWAELENHGLYDTSDPKFDKHSAGDSLDRILYRSGKDLKLTPISKTVPALTGDNGEQYTDHDPMYTVFRYKRIGKISAPANLTKPQPANETKLAFCEIGWTVVRLAQALLGIFELPYLLAQGVEYLINGKMP